MKNRAMCLQALGQSGEVAVFWFRGQAGPLEMQFQFLALPQTLLPWANRTMPHIKHPQRSLFQPAQVPATDRRPPPPSPPLP